MTPPTPSRIDLSSAKDGVIRYEQPLRDGWYLSATFSWDIEHGEIELVEVKVFPGGQRLRWEEWQESPPDQRANTVVPLPDIGEWALSPESFEGVTEGGLTTRLMREVHLGDVIDAVRTQWAQLIAREGGQRHGDLGAALVDAESVRPGRAGRDAHYYLPLAVAYAELVNAGSRRPVAELAARYGVKREHIRDQVFMAREKGLLTGARQGRPSGVLTSTARAMLAEQEQEN